MSGKGKSKIILKKNKDLNKIWHPDSGLVFKSKDEQVVVGQCVDGDLVELNGDIIKTCEKWGFKWDETLCTEEEEVEEVEETEETEEVEEDEEEVEETEEVGDNEEEVEEVEDDTENKNYTGDFDSLYDSFGEAVRALLTESMKRVNALTKKVDTLTRENDTLTKENDTLTKEKVELEECLAVKTEEADKATKKMAQLKALFS